MKLPAIPILKTNNIYYCAYLSYCSFEMINDLYPLDQIDLRKYNREGVISDNAVQDFGFVDI